MDPLNRERVEAAIAQAVSELGRGLQPDARGMERAPELRGVSSAKAPRPGTLIFLGRPDPAALARLAGIAGSIIILPAGVEAQAQAAAGSNLVLRAANPKYAYAVLASLLYPLTEWKGRMERPIGPSSWAASDVFLGEGVVVEPFVTIGRGSRIGSGSLLMRGASIGPDVIMGRDCLIKENAVVGDLGFGFAFDRGLPPRRLPQLGGVRLGDRVEVGALSSIGAGTMEPTLVDDDVKLSDHVHIAHNCRVGAATIVTVGATVSGSSRIGARCWLAPGVTIRNGIAVGDGATLGLGAAVVADVEAGATVAGVPAKPVAGKGPWYDSEAGTP